MRSMFVIFEVWDEQEKTTFTLIFSLAADKSWEIFNFRRIDGIFINVQLCVHTLCVNPFMHSHKHVLKSAALSFESPGRTWNSLFLKITLLFFFNESLNYEAFSTNVQNTRAWKQKCCSFCFPKYLPSSFYSTWLRIQINPDILSHWKFP